jgi:3-oxoacyl-[acyl-carrier protein] reductase
VIDTGLKDRVALITGASRGIGAATTLALAAQGAKIFITDIDAPSKEFVEQVRCLTEAGWYPCDLSDADAPRTLFDRAEERFGRVDVLINNAAAGFGDTFAQADGAHDWAGRTTAFIDAQSIDRHFAVNARAAALLIAEYARRHIARGATWGRIIGVTTGGADCFPGEVSYGASKNALESYTRAAGKELGRFGVTANLIAPGATQTGWISPSLETLILPDVPAGRLGSPEDIADAIVLLASDHARWINCATIFVDGGQRRSN